MYESDAKALAGKEKREMEALFGKKASTSSNHTSSTAKNFEGGSGSVPSIFKGGNAGGTLMSNGAAGFMDASSSKVITEANRGEFGGMCIYFFSITKLKYTNTLFNQTGKATTGTATKLSMGSSGVMDTSGNKIITESNRGQFGGSASSGSVSRLNMGSAGVMNTSDHTHVSETNRGSFGAKHTSSNLGAGKAGAPKIESRDPMSQKGVLRKMPWET
jgi:hypothetical protein